MENHFDEHYEWDANGVLTKKKKRTAHDGEHITFTTISDQAAYGFSPSFSDGSVDHTSPHRPGYRFADVDDAGRIAAQEAYDERSKIMSEKWMQKGGQQQADARDAPPRTRTLDELQKDATAAWEARNKRMQNAWRRD